MTYGPAQSVLDLARARDTKIATAESCTGGMIIAALTDVPGSSDVVDRGFVTYSNGAKMQMLGVRAETLQDYGAVSIEVAREMAAGAVAQSDAQLAVAVTGIAGPGGSEHKPEGRVCFAIAMGDKVQAEQVDFGPLGRNNVRRATTERALSMLDAALSRVS